MTAPLSTIGILGAGQLAMMLAEAAADLGVRTHVYAPGQALLRPVGDRLVVGELDDAAALARFADEVDVITFETENVTIEPVMAVAERTLVRPSPEVVAIAQDRLAEKRFVASLGLGTAPFAPIGPDPAGRATSPADAVAAVGGPAIIKTRRFGYDGKGQVRIDGPDAAAEAWRTLGEVPCIAEGFVPFDTEISVVAARALDGSFVPFDPGLNQHRDGVLVRTTVPAPVPAAAVAAAVEAARAILDAVDYIGVAGIECFVVGEEILINEIAPRVHNSGHWTQLGCAASQFEQHVRAITGRPLAGGHRHVDVEMTNLLGHDVDDLGPLLADPAASIILYGKAEVRAGRKMGHVNRLLPAP
ncbi:MAG: 5-(carboxyamino)imidazole ribonucleotide synthase [Actinomycetota bacterium]